MIFLLFICVYNIGWVYTYSTGPPPAPWELTPSTFSPQLHVINTHTTHTSAQTHTSETNIQLVLLVYIWVLLVFICSWDNLQVVEGGSIYIGEGKCVSENLPHKLGHVFFSPYKSPTSYIFVCEPSLQWLGHLSGSKALIPIIKMKTGESGQTGLHLDGGETLSSLLHLPNYLYCTLHVSLWYNEKMFQIRELLHSEK